MTLPNKYAKLRIQVKHNLASYRACLDCKYAIDRLKENRISYSQWKVEWAGICALLKTSIHLLKNGDAKSCLPEKLRYELKSAYEELGKQKEKYPLFWNFINNERNNILKEYEFSAYEAILKPDGTTRQARTLLDTMQDGEKEALLIRSGEYRGQQALAVLADAANWVENYIFSCIRKAGYDPDERRYAGSLMPIEALKSTMDATILDGSLNEDK